MRIDRSVLSLVAIVAVLLLFVSWLAKRRSDIVIISQSSPPSSSIGGPTGTSEARESNSPSPPKSNISQAANAGVARPLPGQGKEEEAKIALKALNDVPIEFYGKLQDQLGAPIPGADITGSIIYDDGTSNGVVQIKTVSDRNGAFEIHGRGGESLSVLPHKGGYAVASGNNGFKYTGIPQKSKAGSDPSVFRRYSSG